MDDSGKLEGSLPSELAQSWLLAILVGLVGLVLVIGPSVTGDRIPGDLVDNRYNAYVLEHVYRWISRQDQSFWNADFFYPYPLTIAFSDNHLGSGPFYSLFRVAGFDREDAFRLWYALGFVLNFVAAYYALVRLSYTRVAAALGAFLFDFALPITAQESHAQLVYRFGVPLAVLALLQFSSSRRLRFLTLTAFWTVWQFYCSIYLGYFLVLLLGALLIGLALCRAKDRPARFGALLEKALHPWRRETSRARAAFLLATAGLAGLMLFLVVPYLQATHLYDFRRDWSEITRMLPRPASYILTLNSRYWSINAPYFETLPMRWEHAMFIGATAWLTIAVAVILCLARRASLHRLFAPAVFAVLLLALLTLWVHGHSAYWLLARLPGVDAIRAVTRIITVLLFPFAIMLAASFDAIMAARLPGGIRFGAVALLAALLVCEASYITHLTSTKAAWRARIAAIETGLPRSIPEKPILLVAAVPGDRSAVYLQELDAMIFAQDHGWPTLNGYSGNDPRPYQLSGSCQDGPISLAAVDRFLGPSPDRDYGMLIHRMVLVGYPPCDEAVLLRRPQFWSGPVSEALMAKLQLRIEGIAVRDGMILVTVAITNGSDVDLPAYSATGTPIHLSARFVPAGDVTPDRLKGAGLDSRQSLFADIPAGGTEIVSMAVAPPPIPGTYRIAMTMVQEKVAWFHDHGMQVPISTQSLTVGNGLSVSAGGS
jgi:hypothetical protein